MEKDNNSKDDEKIEWDNNSDNLDDVEKDNKKDSKLIRSSKNINLEQSQESQIFNTTNQNQEQLINTHNQNDIFSQRKQNEIQKNELDNSSDNLNNANVLPQKDNKSIKLSKRINAEQLQETKTFDTIHQNQEQLMSTQQNYNFSQKGKERNKIQKKERATNSKKKIETSNSKDVSDKKKQNNKNKNSDTSKSKKFLNHANMIVNSVKFDEEKNSAENFVSTAGNMVVSEGKYFAKKQIKKGIKKIAGKNRFVKSFSKALGKVNVVGNAAANTVSTVNEVFSGNAEEAIKGSVTSAITGDPTKIIVLVCFFLVFAGVGLFSVIGSVSPNLGDLNNANNYVDYNYAESVTVNNFEFDDDDAESINNTSAIKNLNQVYLQLNNYFYGYNIDDNASLLEKLKKNLLDKTNISCDVFSNYVINYFKGEIDDNKLKKNISLYVKKNNLVFNESVGVTNYNTFKYELDTVYKTKFKQIQNKVTSESSEDESYSSIMNKVVNEFKNYF